MADSTTTSKPSDKAAPKQPEPQPKTVIEPVAEPEHKVMFQVDPETVIEAVVVKEHKDGRLDLRALTEPSKYKTNISGGATEKTYERVRPGNKFEPGTFYELPEA
jgi:hypothetical protein